MYNGIGLTTARGSGTNGYVQRNLAFVKRGKDNADYKTEEQLKALDQAMTRGPNKEILEHDRKRKVELKCMEMEELMEEQGYDTDDITEKVNMFRQMLIEKEQSTNQSVELDEAGRPVSKSTHQLAEASLEKNARLKAAFGIGQTYVDGSSFNRQKKEMDKKEAESKEMLAKPYKIVKSSDEESGETKVEDKKKKRKRKHKHRDSSSSPSPERKERHKKKSKKHKKDRSTSRERRKEKDNERERKKVHKSSSKHSRRKSPTDSEGEESPPRQWR